jgi:hypothetical protein
MALVSLRFRLFEEAGAWKVELSADDGAPPVTGDFELDLRREARLTSVLRRIEHDDCNPDDLKDVGSQLWAALLSGPVGERFRSIRLAADDGEAVLQFRLALPPALQALPWEALYDEWSPGFLASRLHYGIVREPPATIRPPRLAQRETPCLRILAVVPEGSGLHVEHEWQNLRDVVGRLGDGIELEQLAGRVTPDHLLEALHTGRYDIFHYIGHGEVGDTGRVTIRVHAEDGVNPELMMDGEAFAALFAGTSVRLAVLNCCLGDYPSPNRSLSGLGPLLMQAGVPAVVAMRYEIPDTAAIRFSKVFYRALLSDPKSPGRVDLAMEQARQSLFLNSGERSLRSFITPVFHLAPACDQLFLLQPAERPTQTAPEPPAIVKTERSLVPDELAEALCEGRCIPVIGPDLLRVGIGRREPKPPGPQQLALALAHECNYPRMEDFEICERSGGWVGALLLPLVCQHYVSTLSHYKLVRAIQREYEESPIPPALLSVASWRVPGIVYTHFDSLLRDALEESGKQAHALNAVDADATVGDEELRVIHLRGMLGDPGSLVLTEDEHDALSDRLSTLPPSIVHLLVGKDRKKIGRTLLFLGVSPRDPIIRRLVARLLGPELAKIRGKAFFACRRRDAVEEAYWKRFEALEWIEAETEALIAALDAAAEGR